MRRKIFVSYKYADSDVYKLTTGNDFIGAWGVCTVRDYVDKMEELLDNTDHIYKGESDGEDLSQLSEETIWNKLRDRIYDSTLTIVMLSKGMRVTWETDKNQWIPREISYSLKETSRKDKNGNPVTSTTNALLAVIIPDLTGSYSYFTGTKSCCDSGCTYYNTQTLFSIMKNNMFNIKNPNSKQCDDGSTVYYGDSSYMCCVKWEDFITDVNKYIEKAYEIRDKKDDYDIQKEV